MLSSQSGAFYSKSLTFRPDTLIPASGIKDFFNYLDTANKDTLVRPASA